MKHSKITGPGTLNRVLPSRPGSWYAHPNDNPALFDKTKEVPWRVKPSIVRRFRKILLIAVLLPVISLLGALCWFYLRGLPKVASPPS